MTSGAPHWSHGLAGASRRIAELDRSPLRVLAGPGTGKTFALMRRVARLLEAGADPSRILVCTFTRTAAADLGRELAALGVPGIERVRAGTLHAFCFSLLSRNEVLHLTGRVPRPLLKFEERFLLEDLQPGFGGIRDRDRRLNAFNAAWARMQSDDPGWPANATDRSFHHSLLAWLRFHRAMLIGELVPETLHYLRDNPASPHRRVFDHVLVDEFQDLNRAEQTLLDLLAEGGTLTIIGDEDQSIYSFKYAHPEGIAGFGDSHPDTHDETLEDCHRCPSRVIEIAQALIGNNLTRTNRILRAVAANPKGEVHVVQWPSLREEAEGIAQFIDERVRAREADPGQVLVLAPRRQFGYAVRDALNSLGVLALSFFHEEALDGNPKVMDDSKAQQAFTLLTLLADSSDWVALRSWCGFGSDSMRSGAWRRLRDHCETSGETPRVALERLSSGAMSLPYAGDLVARVQALEGQVAGLDGIVGQELVDRLFPTGESWADPFRTLATAIEGDEFSPFDLREALRIGITQPELPTAVDYVRIMSLHKSKGLSADLVIVVGCIEGLIPTIDDSAPAADQQRSLEEQRRLFYVAITRTRSGLVLSSVTRLPRNLAYRMGAQLDAGYGSETRTVTSRFIAELGSTCPQGTLGSSILRSGVT